jgi:aminocarboxymuconate-semialdehyde decarboxylase
VNGRNLDDPALDEFFAAAHDLDAAVLLHPWDMLAMERMKDYWLPWLVGMPTECTIALCSLIFGGVLEKYPRMRLCVAHGGGSFPYLIGRIEHGFHARPDLVAIRNQENPRKYLKQVYFDSATHDAEALRHLLKVSDEDHVILGSDYPFPLGEKMPGLMIEQMEDLSIRTKTKLLGTNALHWLGE